LKSARQTSAPAQREGSSNRFRFPQNPPPRFGLSFVSMAM
jgi:hypothetical protein